MADEPQANGPVLPPKLDLRKKGILKTPQSVTSAPPTAVADDAPTVPTVSASVPVPPAAPPVARAVGPAPVMPSAPVGAPSATVRLKPKIPLSTAPGGPAATLTVKPLLARTQVTSPAPFAAAPSVAVPGSAPSAVQPKLPVVPPLSAAPTVGTTSASSKRETSRIPLEAARVGMGEDTPASAAPKTIRIKPVSADTSASSAPTVVAKPGVLAAPTVTRQADPKRQTSRISLEAALGSEGAAGGPKTIRLKRPAEGGTVKVTRPDAATSGKTAAIDLPDEVDDASTTQRKTIRVKRPTQRRTVKSVSVARRPGDAGDDGVPMAASSADTMRPVDSAHWTFITFAIIAIIVGLVMIYMLAAQTFGPDFSLTRLSYGMREMDLPWPGKLVR